MSKKIDRRSVDRINWASVANARSKKKLAIKEAVKKAGNCRKLSFLTGVSVQLISMGVNETDPDKDLFSPRNAIKLEKGVKIKGLAERLCPSLKI